MRTIKSLSNKKLDELQERLEQKKKRPLKLQTLKRIQWLGIKIAGERLRRIGL